MLRFAAYEGDPGRVLSVPVFGRLRSRRPGLELVDVEIALCEEPGTVRFGEGVVVSKVRKHERAFVACTER